MRFPGDVLLSPGIMLPRPITLSRAAVIHTRSRLQTVPRHGKCVQRWAGPLVLGAQPPVVSSSALFPISSLPDLRASAGASSQAAAALAAGLLKSWLI